MVVLMSWCRLTTLTPVTFWIIASMTGRTVSSTLVGLFEKVSPFLSCHRLDELLFGGGRDLPEADEDEIADHVRVNFLGPPPHVLLLESGDSFTDGGFDVSLSFQESSNKSHLDSKARKGRRAGETIGPMRGRMPFLIAEYFN